ncbi:MAG TPA: hypothetical protein VOA64_13305 [Candidatus Dormibacteraeota bacterium]|nr:hypothetical protein [Candidatus Dormibacteraeota bacterium]
MIHHTLQFTIGDEDAVRVLVDKLVNESTHQLRRRKLLHALEDATQRYLGSDEQARQAFFHGLLTGYAVALKLW